MLHPTEPPPISRRSAALIRAGLHLIATAALLALAFHAWDCPEHRWRLIATLAILQAMPCAIAAVAGFAEVFEATALDEAPREPQAIGRNSALACESRWRGFQ